MIDIKERELVSILEQAIRKLNQAEHKQLISITKKIKQIDPLQFFEAGNKLHGDRTFWTNTMEDFVLVGIGNIYEIIANEDRFDETKREWNQLLKKANIHNPYELPGTGLVSLGGMSFDPKKEKTGLWKHFEDSQFKIPEFVLTKYKQAYYLTINILVNTYENPLLLAKDIQLKERLLLTPVNALPQGAGIKTRQEISPEAWKETVSQAKETIKNGQAEKIVLARELRLQLTKEAEITVILKKLLETQPNSYVFAFEHGEDCFVGATPERLVKVKKQQLLSTCLAGTAPRGKTEEEDVRIRHDFLHDEKNLQEHDFVVQMIRAGIEKYCTNIVIPEKPVVYPLKNLQHLYTPVTATLKNDTSIFDLIKQLHPTPALGGTPYKESLAFIREQELLDRGWYGAPVGWVDSNQNGEFAVAIRSGLFQGNEASLFAGCGIVKDSNVEAEYEETNIKFMPMLSVLGV